MSLTFCEDPFFNVVLVEPEIPQNTGNIGRSCVGAKSHLHLIEPIAFEINDKQLRRAGLDYWPHLTWKKYPHFSDWNNQVSDLKRVFYFSTKAKISYSENIYQKGDWLVFGKETKGLDESLIYSNFNQALTIPMYGPIRSLNLATSVAIVLFEGLRQLT